MAVGDIVLDAEVGYVVSLTLLDEQFQVALGVERIEATRWIAQAVDDIGLEAVCIIYYRLNAVSLFETLVRLASTTARGSPLAAKST